MPESKQIMDEKLIDLIKKIEIPKNPLSFYINSKKIEKSLSEWVRDYFYKAINEFISPMVIDNDPYNIKKKYGYSNFLFKLYYYSWFTKNLSDALNDFLNILKYYDVGLYLKCSVWLDWNMKFKLQAIMENLDIFDQISSISSKKDVELLIKNYKLDNKPNVDELISRFEDFLYSKSLKEIKEILQKLEINIPKYPLSYQETKVNFEEYSTSDKYKSWYFHFSSVMICFANIVNFYDRKNYYTLDFWAKLERKYNDFLKYSVIKEFILKKNKFEAWKELFNSDKINKYFNSKSELRKYIVTYLINIKASKLKRFFYWEAIQARLSEDDWAMLWGTNLFYLQKIDNNISEFNMLLFFKNFKDTLISLYDSIFWPFIKPYFYYILVFKAIKLPLKDWQKFFFLLMFFSAESYEEYIILQTIYKNVEKVWLWDFSENKNKILYYFKRFVSLLRIFLSSIILLLTLVFVLWGLWFLNFVMLVIVLLLLVISFLKYWFFPGRFEILRTFTLIIASILWYIWFTTVFPKIMDPKYFTYLGNELHSLVSLNFDQAKDNYNKMIAYIYGKDYKQYENKLITSIFSWTNLIKNNKAINELFQKTTKLTTDILQEYKTKYIKLKKGEYIKLIIDREIDRLIPGIRYKDKEKLSKQVFLEYLKYYCSLHHDYYCRTWLSKVPIWFKVNLTKIDELIKSLSWELNF